MTARARKRLGIRQSFRLWLTPLGETVASALVLLGFALSAFLLSALVGP